MFGADAAHMSFTVREQRRPVEQREHEESQYLFPSFNHPSPWQSTRVSSRDQGQATNEDCIMIAEFSEQEGPRPLLVIPKDGGEHFDKNDFSVKILAVDHQSSIVEGCELTEDAQVVMSDPSKGIHAFIHHIVLNDIQARGYVRPFCISYITTDPIKVMKCYEELSSQMKKVARLMKYGNRLVFMRDLEKHLEDLSYTKAHLLISQSRSQMSTQADNDLLNALNTLRQRMEEIMDIVSNLKPIIQMEVDLAERFQGYEKLLKVEQQTDRHSDTSSLKDFDANYPEPPAKEISGSYSDRTSPDFSLFVKSKDLKPKLLDVSTIRGKRRFDRSLRGLHELCSWGAKEGLQRLRAFREFLKRDLCGIYTDELDISALEPDIGVLSFGYNSIGANFLTVNQSLSSSCCGRRLSSDTCPDHGTLPSLGSMESFKSLSTSFQSFQDDDPVFSAHSSCNYDIPPVSFHVDRPSSRSDSLFGRDSTEAEDQDFMFSPTEYSMSLRTAVDLDISGSTNRSFLDTLTEQDDRANAKIDHSNAKVDNSVAKVHDCVAKPDNSDVFLRVKQSHVRANSQCSDFDSIDILSDSETTDDMNAESDSSKISKTDDKGKVDTDFGNTKCNGSKTLSLNIRNHIKPNGSMSSKEQLERTNSACVNSSTSNETMQASDTKDERETSDNDPDNTSTPHSVDNDRPMKANLEEKEMHMFAQNNDTKDNVRSSINIRKTGNRQCSGQECEDEPDSKTNAKSSKMTVLKDANEKESMNNSEGNVDDICENTDSAIAKVANMMSNVEDKLELKSDSSENIGDGKSKKSFDPHVQSNTNESGDSNVIDKNKLEVNTKAKHDPDITSMDATTDDQKVREPVNLNRNGTGLNVSDQVNSDQRVFSNKSRHPSALSEAIERELKEEKNKNETDEVKLETETETGGKENDGTGEIIRRNLESVMSPERRKMGLNVVPEKIGFLSFRGTAGVDITGSRKWRFLHPYRNLFEGEKSIVQSLQKVLTGYNHMQHVVYSLLLGRPVVVIGNKRQEPIIRDLVQALSMFVVSTPKYTPVTLVCQIQQLKMIDVHKFKLRGIIRPERRSTDYLLPKTVRRYITILDLEKSVLHCQPYQGVLLNWLLALRHKKSSFKSDFALFLYLQLCLEDISTKAFHYYHSFLFGDWQQDINIKGTTIQQRSQMLDLAMEKYFSRAGLMNSDCKIIKHLAEFVKVQQIEEEYKYKYLTGSLASPFHITYQTIQTFKL